MTVKLDPLAKAAYETYWAGLSKQSVTPFGKLDAAHRRRWTKVVQAVFKASRENPRGIIDNIEYLSPGLEPILTEEQKE